MENFVNDTSAAGFSQYSVELGYIVSRLKLEIPCVYENDPAFGLHWFNKVRNTQESLLKQSLDESEIKFDIGYEEHADEAETVCQQKFLTISYKICSRNFYTALLRATNKYFTLIKQAGFPPFMQPLVILPTSECFDPKLIACHSDVPLGAFFWGNIQGGSYLNHWEVSMDVQQCKSRSSDKIFVDFEYDRMDMIIVKFLCEEEKTSDDERQRRERKKAAYRIIVSRSLIRRIIIDNAVHDIFGSGRTRIHLELNNPPLIHRLWLDERSKHQKPIFQRITTVKHGRLENEYPKDSELSNCPFFSLEFAQKVESSKIFSIISRLRSRTGLSIEFGTFPMVDCIMKMDRPYFTWVDRNPKYGYYRPTSDKCPIFRDFLYYTIPKDTTKAPNEQAEDRRRRFVIMFLIECLLSRGAIVKDQICLHRHHWIRFLQIIAVQVKMDFDRAERTLERLVTMIDERKRIGSLNKTLLQLFDLIREEDNNPAILAYFKDESREGYQRVRKIIITPTRTIYVVPEMMMGNRVLRRFDPQGINVLRASFRDDDGNKMRLSKTGKWLIDKAVFNNLRDGLYIAGIYYGYLGSSNSQMRDHGAYFMQTMSHLDIKEWRRIYDKRNFEFPPKTIMWQILDVRKSLGKFEKIESVPKLMARLGQCFTQSRESGVSLPTTQCICIHDVIGGNNSQQKEYTFTDGVGCISKDFALRIAKDFGIPKGFPSCYQFRYRGMKGVLGVDNQIDAHNAWAKKKDRGSPPETCSSWIVHVALRSSQDKFYGARQEFIEIVKVSGPSPVCLNKPFINILDQVSQMQGYDVHKRVTERIESLLDRQMRGFASQMIDETTCRNRLKELPRRIDIDKLSTAAGFEMSNEIFFRSLIKSSVKYSVTKQLRKAQIQIPFEKGRMLLGIADETGRLQYGQIFCQVTKSIRDRFPHPNATKMVLKGTVLITKNPCIVAGDVRIFDAVDIPELSHLVDVVVFPVYGPRPHADEMAGSDLDGDEYCVIWDKQLLLKHNEPPFDFTVPKRVDMDIGEGLQEKMAKFYVSYMTQDSVGAVANAFLGASDLYGINATVCMRLAKKNSEAVDFTKSGQAPAPLTKNWQVDPDTQEEIPPEKLERVPDFQATDVNRPSYMSHRLLGKLTREIKGIEDVMKIAEDKDEQSIIELDPYLVVSGWQNYQSVAEDELAKYNTLLRTTMETFGIRTEAEIFSGCICDIRNRLSDKDQDDMSFFNTNQVIETKITNQFRRFRENFFEEFGGWHLATEKVDRPFADDNNVCHRECKLPTENQRKKAVAFYITCYERAQTSGERMLSFAWLAYDILAIIKQEKIRANSTYTITGNPLFPLLSKHINNYIEERQEQYDKFCNFDTRTCMNSAVEPLRKYCRKYNGLDRLLFIVHEWAWNLKLYTTRFSSIHLSLLAIMYLINGFSSIDGDAIQLLLPILPTTKLEELIPEPCGNQAGLLLKFFEFLTSRKFGRLQHISFKLLGVPSLFSRGEWLSYHRSAITSYYNMVYNLRFEELPLKKDVAVVKMEVIREMEPFTIELPEDVPVTDDTIRNKMLKKSGVEDIQLRRQPKNKVLVSARGTFESLDALRKLVSVMPPIHSAGNGKQVQEQLFNLVFEKIMKDEVIEYDNICDDSDNFIL